MEAILDALAGPAPSEKLVAAAGRVRAAADHADAIRAVQHLRETLTLLGLYVEHATLTTLFARVLRPGSSPALDGYLEATLTRWRILEERAGIVVEARAFALARARDAGLHKILPSAPSSGDEGELRSWTYATLVGLLWRRPSSMRRETLGLGNPFIETPACDRLIIPLPKDVSPIVRLESESWLDELTEALNRGGVARLLATPDKKERLSDALRHLAITPIDTGGMHVFVRFAGYVRLAGGMALTLEMPEALQ
jgi:hypothetical protein